MQKYAAALEWVSATTDKFSQCEALYNTTEDSQVGRNVTSTSCDLCKNG